MFTKGFRSFAKHDGGRRGVYKASEAGEELNVKILKATRQIEDGWRIKSRQSWLKGGDSNIEYFHKQTKVHHSYNAIKELKDNHGNKIIG